MKIKKLLIASIFIVGVATVTSCKRDYTCECTATTGGISASASSTIRDTKSGAQEACEAGSSQSAGVSVTCEIL